MDRLPSEEKVLLQTLAVIGREFSSSLLRKVVTEREDELRRLLSRLQAGEFVYGQPAFPEVEYLFKHALTQEVAYNSLLIERRKVLHERTAQAIEEVYRHRLDDHYSELAYHYSRSGNTQKAVDYLQLSGQQAVQRSANAEAIMHLTTALDLLTTLTPSSVRDQQELLLQLALGPVLIATKGWATREVEQTYTRAQELCQQIGEFSQLFSALWGLWLVRLIGADLARARALAEQMLVVAEKSLDTTHLLIAHFALGNTSFWQGELTSARKHLEQGVTLYDTRQHRALASLYAVDPGVYCLSYLLWALVHLGYSERALQRSREALKLANELSHPHSLVFALTFAAWGHQIRREARVTQERAEATIALSTEHGFPDWLAWATTQRGWALAEQGEQEQGIAHMQQGLAASRSTGAELLRPYFLALLAATYGDAGQPAEGLRILEEALVLVRRNHIRHYEAELYRLKGELTLQQASQKSKGKRQK